MNILYATLRSFGILLFASQSFSQLSITSTGTDYTINFESTVLGVNEGIFESTGFSPNPAPGQLDSDGLYTTGLSDGDGTFGGTDTLGDFARGTSIGGTTIGGIYAFEVSTGNYSLGIQPIGADFTPGSIVLKVDNKTGGTMHSVHFSYELYVYNDQGRSNFFNPSWSIDDITYTDLPSMNYTSVEVADAEVAWVLTQFTTSFNVSLNDGESLFFKWTGDDVSGSGSRDEFAIDNITINMSSAMLPVTYLSFTAESREGEHRLKWVTTDEINHSHFEVQYSLNGWDWEMIGKVENGSHFNSVNQYAFTYSPKQAGAHYYRLRQVDIDGAFKMSPVRKVWNTKVHEGLKVYPNPASDVLYIIGLNGEAISGIEIIDLSGKTYITEASSNRLNIDLLPSGMHILRVHTFNAVQNHSFVKK